MTKTETSTTVDTETAANREKQVGHDVPPEPDEKAGETLVSSEPANPESGTNPVSSGEAEPETFDREYVEKLRKEAADHRVKAKDRDDLAQRLHTALVAQSGALADPTDLAYDEAHLSDPDALTAAIEALVTAKPHLAARTPHGDVGQGSTKAVEGVDLAAILRGAL